MYVRYDDDVLFLYMLYNDVRHFYQRKCQVPVQRGGGVGEGGRGAGGIEKWTQFYGWVEKIIGPEEKVAIR